MQIPRPFIRHRIFFGEQADERKQNEVIIIFLFVIAGNCFREKCPELKPLERERRNRINGVKRVTISGLRVRVGETAQEKKKTSFLNYVGTRKKPNFIGADNVTF